ncbi:MAG: hypothetical protein MI974_26170, partial [Chitinophagales bacterium]|nr:hypothetical protein [Chitinophagales bacterium]
MFKISSIDYEWQILSCTSLNPDNYRIRVNLCRKVNKKCCLSLFKQHFEHLSSIKINIEQIKQKINELEI